jgi:hypothetical protein
VLEACRPNPGHLTTVDAALKFRSPVRPAMAEDLEPEVRDVLSDVNAAYEEYERGYADADATLRVVRSHLDRLEAELD